jgi:hypothetical protein
VAAPPADGTTVPVAVGVGVTGGVGATLVGGPVGVASALGGAGGAVVGGVAVGFPVGVGVFEGEGVRDGLGRTLRDGDGLTEGCDGVLVTGVTSTGLGEISGRGGRTHR